MIYPGTYNLVIYRKSSFDLLLRFKSGPLKVPMNLGGYNILAQLWDAAGTYAVDSFQVDTDSAEIGEITLYLSSAQTTALYSGGKYDLKLVEPSGKEYYYLKGRYTIKEGLTDD